MHLCVEIQWFPYYLPLVFNRSYSQEYIWRKNLSTTKEGTLVSLSLNTFCRWSRVVGEGSALPQAEAPSSSSSSLTPFSMAPPKLRTSPISERRSSKPSQSLVPGPVGVPGSLTPGLGPPVYVSSAFVFHLVGATGRVRLTAQSIISLVS